MGVPWVATWTVEIISPNCGRWHIHIFAAVTRRKLSYCIPQDSKKLQKFKKLKIKQDTTHWNSEIVRHGHWGIGGRPNRCDDVVSMLPFFRGAVGCPSWTGQDPNIQKERVKLARQQEAPDRGSEMPGCPRKITATWGFPWSWAIPQNTPKTDGLWKIPERNGWLGGYLYFRKLSNDCQQEQPGVLGAPLKSVGLRSSYDRDGMEY